MKKKVASLLTSTTVTKHGVVTERDGKITMLLNPRDPEEVELTGGRFFRVQHQAGPFILAAELLAKYHVVEHVTQRPKGGPVEIEEAGSY